MINNLKTLLVHFEQFLRCRSVFTSCHHPCLLKVYKNCLGISRRATPKNPGHGEEGCLEIVSNFSGISTIPSQNSGKVRIRHERNPRGPRGIARRENCHASTKFMTSLVCGLRLGNIVFFIHSTNRRI